MYIFFYMNKKDVKRKGPVYLLEKPVPPRPPSPPPLPPPPRQTTAHEKKAEALNRSFLRRYDMNGIFQMQGGKNWFLPK